MCVYVCMLYVRMFVCNKQWFKFDMSSVYLSCLLGLAHKQGRGLWYYR